MGENKFNFSCHILSRITVIQDLRAIRAPQLGCLLKLNRRIFKFLCNVIAIKILWLMKMNTGGERNS